MVGAEEKLVEIPLEEVHRMSIDMKCLDVGIIRKYGNVYRDEDGCRWNFSGAYRDDARHIIVFRFET